MSVSFDNHCSRLKHMGTAFAATTRYVRENRAARGLRAHARVDARLLAQQRLWRRVVGQVVHGGHAAPERVLQTPANLRRPRHAAQHLGQHRSLSRALLAEITEANSVASATFNCVSGQRCPDNDSVRTTLPIARNVCVRLSLRANPKSLPSPARGSASHTVVAPSRRTSVRLVVAPRPARVSLAGSVRVLGLALRQRRTLIVRGQYCPDKSGITSGGSTTA